MTLCAPVVLALIFCFALKGSSLVWTPYSKTHSGRQAAFSLICWASIVFTRMLQAAGDVSALSPGAQRRHVLDSALKTLVHSVAEYCPSATKDFLEFCQAATQSCHSWKDAVEDRSSRKPTWKHINDNTVVPLECSKCHEKFKPPSSFENKAKVYFQQGGLGLLEGHVKSKLEDAKYAVEVVVNWQPEPKEFRVRLKDLWTEGKHKDCRHCPNGTVEKSPTNYKGLVPEELYDYKLHNIYDVVKLFIPYGLKDFKTDFHEHDGTNLFNLLAAIAQA